MRRVFQLVSRFCAPALFAGALVACDKLPLGLAGLENCIIPPSGGVCRDSLGVVVLTVPAGAVSETVLVKIAAPTTGFDSLPSLVPGTVYDVETVPSLAQLNAAAQLSVKFGFLSLPAGVRLSELGLFRVVTGAWHIASPAVIDSANGILTVSARAFGVYGILGAPVDTVALSRVHDTVQVGGSSQLKALPQDSAFDSLPKRRVRWSSANPLLASVDSTGLVRGVGAGVTTVLARSELAASTVSLTVQVGASAATSTVTVSKDSVASGSAVTLTLQAKDQTGTNITTGGATVTFSYAGGTSTGTVGPVTDNANGTYTAAFTGITAGTPTTIHATINTAQVTSTLPTVAVVPGPISTSQSLVFVASGNVAVGATTTLILLGRDAAGNNLISGGAAVQFTATGGTSKGTIGSTTDVGNGTYTAPFTGDSAGTPTTIGAMISGVPVTSLLPTLAVGGVNLNEPAGMTELSNRPFSSETCNANDYMEPDSVFNGAYGWYQCATVVASGNWSIVSDTTAPESRPLVGQILYPAGFTGSGVPPTTTSNFGIHFTQPGVAFNPGVVYIHVWVKLSSNFQGHPSGVNKIIFWKMGSTVSGGAAVVTLVAFGSGSGPLGFMMRAQGAGSYLPSRPGGATLNLAQNLGQASDNAITRGQWTDAEVVVQTNTPGSYNGVVDVWVRGVHTAHYSDIMWCQTGQPCFWDDVDISPIWGGNSTQTVIANMYMWLDHLYVSGRQ